MLQFACFFPWVKMSDVNHIIIVSLLTNPLKIQAKSLMKYFIWSKNLCCLCTHGLSLLWLKHNHLCSLGSVPKYCLFFSNTLLVDFAVKLLNWSDEEKVRLQLWDIAGTEKCADQHLLLLDMDATVNCVSSFQARNASYPWPESIIKVQWAALWCLTSAAHPVSSAVASGNRTWTTRPCCLTETPSPASWWPTRSFSHSTKWCNSNMNRIFLFNPQT